MTIREIVRHPYFIVGLAVKIVFLFFFGSSYLRELFIPFIDHAIVSPWVNPWSQLPANYFPYGSGLFLVLYIPKMLGYLLFGDLALGGGPVGLFLVKLPLLICDFLLLLGLASFSRNRLSNLLLFYWLNPVLFFITYIHGQLDVVSMTFLVFSTRFLIDKRMVVSALCFAGAILCKFHVALVMPFLLVFIWNREFSGRALKQISIWLMTWWGAVSIGFTPLLMANRFLYSSVSSPEAHRLFALRVNYKGNNFVYLGIILVLATCGRLLISTKISPYGLISGVGLLMGVLVLATDPMPGWFYWVVPFVSLFYALHLNAPRILFWSLSFCYLIAFGAHGSDWAFGLPSGVFLTLLQTLLGAVLYMMWKLMVERECPLEHRTQPRIIGISGNSGSGKNHLTMVLKDIFGRDETLTVEGDDYHRWGRGNEMWQRYTHLDPKANNLLLMARNTEHLLRGQSVEVRHYDHSTGQFSDNQQVLPKRTIIVQGLHALYLRSFRQIYSLRIFIAPTPNLHLAWKINRDVRERGHAVEKVLESFRRRDEDSKVHIEPQREFADWIIEYVEQEELNLDQIERGDLPKFNLRYTVWNDARIDGLVHALEDVPGSRVQLMIQPENIDRLIMTIDGMFTEEQIALVADRVFPNLRHTTRNRRAPNWRAGFDGIHQLMTIALLHRPRDL